MNNNYSPKQSKSTSVGIYNIEKIGRILQLCLMDIRLLEKNVESNENQKRRQTRDLSQLVPCLTTIRKKLDGCIGYLSESINTIETTLHPTKQIQKIEGMHRNSANDVAYQDEHSHEPCDGYANEDEVFEAYISKHSQSYSQKHNVMIKEDLKTATFNSRESQLMMKELRVALYDKQKEWAVREAKALARQKGVSEVPLELEANEDPILQDKPTENLDKIGLDNKMRSEICRNSRSSSEFDIEDHSLCLKCDQDGALLVNNKPNFELPERDIGHKLLGKSKLFKRPYRPAAYKKRIKDNGQMILPDVYMSKSSDIQINSQNNNIDISLSSAAAAKGRMMRSANGYSSVEDTYGDGDM